MRAETLLELFGHPWGGLVVRAIEEDPALDALTLVFRYISQVRDDPPEATLEAARSLGPKAEEAAMTTYDQLIARGEAKGKAKGKAELLLRQLSLRFGAVPAELAERVRAASVDELDAMAERILTAASAADVVG